jgi:hypothetical protein
MRDPRSDESPKQESSVERWARKAENQARETAKIDQGIDDDDEIDFSSMPPFETFEEANALLLERVAEWHVKKFGRWELFQNSRRVPGFKEAEASWKRASGEFLRREGYSKVASGPLNADELFFCRVGRDPSGALIDYHLIVTNAAQRGDVDFFRRIASEIKRVARRRKRRSTLVFHMLHNWLHGFLWLMSSTWGSYYLQHITGETVSEENYQKLRQRLKLVGWENAHQHPLIEGYTPKTGAFTFRQGWTNLNPGLSK